VPQSDVNREAVQHRHVPVRDVHLQLESSSGELAGGDAEGIYAEGISFAASRHALVYLDGLDDPLTG
jgi:hypothetical protein